MAEPRLSSTAVRVLTHPAVAAAAALLLLNDHVLKARWSGPATGIASDVAGLALAPALVATMIGVIGGHPVGWRSVVVVAGVIALAFAAVELVPTADALYESGLGVIGRPVRAVAGGGGLDVVATSDPADLLALPAVALVPYLWRRYSMPWSTA